MAVSAPQDVVLSGPILAALVFAVLAGSISFFSPCVLPLVPVYLSYVTGVAGQDAATVGRAATGTAPSSSTRTMLASRTMVGAGLFVLGFSVVFTAYGALFGRLGQTLVRHQDVLVRVSGVVTIVMGLLFAGVLSRFTATGRTLRPTLRPRVGLAGAPVLGGLFAIGWTPCIGPTLAAVLTLSTTAATAERGALLTFAYSIGLGVPFLVAAATIGRATRTFASVRRHSRAVTRLGGALLVGIGLLQVSGAWSDLLVATQRLLVGWQSPL